MSKKTIKVTDALGRALADSYALLQIAHLYHWNVVGPRFIQLHTFFEEQYTELFTAVDVIAERMRALDVLAPGSLAKLRGMSSVEDVDATAEDMKMVAGYLKATNVVIDGLRLVAKAAEEAGDIESADLATARLQSHTKTAWMLRSMLK